MELSSWKDGALKARLDGTLAGPPLLGLGSGLRRIFLKLELLPNLARGEAEEADSSCSPGELAPLTGRTVVGVLGLVESREPRGEGDGEGEQS